MGVTDLPDVLKRGEPPPLAQAFMQHMDSRDPFAGVLARMRHDVLTLTSGSSGRRSFHILGHIPSYFVLRYRGRPPPAPMPSLHFVSLPNHVVQESTESIVGRVSAAFVKCCPDLRSASDDRDTSSASGVASRGEHNNDGGGDDDVPPAIARSKSRSTVVSFLIHSPRLPSLSLSDIVDTAVTLGAAVPYCSEQYCCKTR